MIAAYVNTYIDHVKYSEDVYNSMLENVQAIRFGERYDGNEKNAEQQR